MSHQTVAAALSDTATMIDRSVRLTRRNADTLFAAILLPLLMMALFVYVFGGAISTGTQYVNYVVPGILLLLYVVALSWLAAGLGVIARSVESASTLSFFMLFLPYLSSAFVPTETMPGWLRPISTHQPITPVIETVRGFLTGAPVGDNGLRALAWCCGLLLFSVVLATSLYRRQTRR